MILVMTTTTTRGVCSHYLELSLGFKQCASQDLHLFLEHLDLHFIRQFLSVRIIVHLRGDLVEVACPFGLDNRVKREDRDSMFLRPEQCVEQELFTSHNTSRVCRNVDLQISMD